LGNQALKTWSTTPAERGSGPAYRLLFPSVSLCTFAYMPGTVSPARPPHPIARGAARVGAPQHAATARQHSSAHGFPTSRFHVCYRAPQRTGGCFLARDEMNDVKVRAPTPRHGYVASLGGSSAFSGGRDHEALLVLSSRYGAAHFPRRRDDDIVESESGKVSWVVCFAFAFWAGLSACTTSWKRYPANRARFELAHDAT
jgi:hypothetical protein